MGTVELFYRFGTALAIGLLVGIQREFSQSAEPDKEPFAGVRTFSLLGLTGCTASFLADEAATPWILVSVVVVLGALVVASYVVTSKRDVGATTEVAAVLTVLSGALCYRGHLGLPVALGFATTVLLSSKVELRRLVARITREDIVATLKFGVITAIILPVLPNEGVGPPPFDVVNPHKIWLMVVLISGLGFVGYLLMQIVGPRRAIGLTGLLGGLASSTAVTLTFAQRSRGRERLAKPFAFAIIIAWTVMFVRVLIVVFAVNRPLLAPLWFPMVVATVVALAFALWLTRGQDGASRDEDSVEVVNPFELGPAVRFGLLYGLILLVARAAQLHLGEGGAYLSAAVAGLADVDAITLSMAELSRSGAGLPLPVAAQAIVLAAMTNTAVKGGVVLTTASSPLKRAIAPAVTAILAVTLVAGFIF